MSKFVLAAMACVFGSLVLADETILDSVELPGSSIEQQVTFHPSRSEYNESRDAVLAKLNKGDSAAMVNPAGGPWKLVETTASIGLAVKGIGVHTGKKHLRRITAAEEALYIFQITEKAK